MWWNIRWDLETITNGHKRSTLIHDDSADLDEDHSSSKSKFLDCYKTKTRPFRNQVWHSITSNIAVRQSMRVLQVMVQLRECFYWWSSLRDLERSSVIWWWEMKLYSGHIQTSIERLAMWRALCYQLEIYQYGRSILRRWQWFTAIWRTNGWFHFGSWFNLVITPTIKIKNGWSHFQPSQTNFSQT